MNASPITSTNSARSRSPAEMMSQTAVMAGLTASELAIESIDRAAEQAPRQQDEQRGRQDPAPGRDQRLPPPSLRQVDGGQVQQERQQRQHEAEVAQRADEVLEPAQLAGLHHDELAGVLNRLTVEQGGDARLERGERGVELDDVRLARILEHRGDLSLHVRSAACRARPAGPGGRTTGSGAGRGPSAGCP